LNSQSYGKLILPTGKWTLPTITVANFISVKINSSSAEKTFGEIIHNTNNKIARLSGFMDFRKKRGFYFTDMTCICETCVTISMPLSQLILADNTP
jgi:hypothetical protein